MEKQVTGGNIQKMETPGGKGAASCCSPAESTTKADAGSCCGQPKDALGQPGVVDGSSRPATVTVEWSQADYIGQIKCRLGFSRMEYTVSPGLYAVGKPDNGSDVLVSANYKLSFDILRHSLKGLSVWILALDTKCINVWCAAGKGTFGTDELVSRISATGLKGIVSHKRIILPQLGAPGVAAHVVHKKTGFNVYYGPVDAKDIPAYIAAGYAATADMRTVKFTFTDRLVLTPMELVPALKKYPLYALSVLALFGLGPLGIRFESAWSGGWPFLLIGLITVLAGAFVTPALLNVVPSRSFAVKGWITGMALLLASSGFTGIFGMDYVLMVATFILFPLLSSYIALQFTGSTVFTGMSGVKKELKFAIPVYLLAAFISFVLIVIYKLREFGVA